MYGSYLSNISGNTSACVIARRVKSTPTNQTGSVSPMPKSDTIIQTLFLAGIGGALISSSILAGATLLLAISGIALHNRGHLTGGDWKTPKELRLIHFAFWFFVLTSAVAWAIDGFTYEGGKTLGTHARFLLFWPLILVLAAINVKSSTVLTAFTMAAASAVGLLAADIISHQGSFETYFHYRFGGGINPISFGNITLLVSLLSWVGSGP